MNKSVSPTSYFARFSISLIFILTLFSCQNSNNNPIISESPGIDDSIFIEEVDPFTEINISTEELFPSYTNQTSLPFKWQTLELGLLFTEVDAKLKCNIGDSKITLLKIDPALFDFELINAKQLKQQAKTIDQWASENELIAAVNAGMYQSDHTTNMGFMKNYDFLNNSKMNAQYNLVAAFNPKSEHIPAFQIIDITCQNWDTLQNQYHSFTQSIRMTDCNANSKWSKQEKYWSMVAIGEDNSGHSLFTFTRSPYAVHDYINMLLDLPIELTKLMYLEGGPEASIYLNHPNKQVSKMGSYETNFNHFDDNDIFWHIPNIIGIRKKDETGT